MITTLKITNDNWTTYKVNDGENIIMITTKKHNDNYAQELLDSITTKEVKN